MVYNYLLIALLVVATHVWVYFGVPLYKYSRVNKSSHPMKCWLSFLLFLCGGHAVGFAWLVTISAIRS
jgi:hypothetical protein